MYDHNNYESFYLIRVKGLIDINLGKPAKRKLLETFRMAVSPKHFRIVLISFKLVYNM